MVSSLKSFGFGILFLITGILLTWGGRAWAGVTKVNVDCDAERVFVGESFSFRVTVSVDGGQVPKPRIPPIENLIVRFQPNITLRSNINGLISQTFSYRAVAQKPGIVTLAGIEAGGVTAEPVRVQVVDRKQTPAKAPVERPPIFVEARVDRTEVWQGEQIVFEYYLYFNQGSASRGGLKAPGLDDALSAFITKDIDVQPNPRETIVDGKKYLRALLVRRVLFPLEPGEYEIPPIRLLGDWQVRDRRARRDFFSIFGETSVPLDHLAGGPVQSEPIKIKVFALPEKDRPADFSGTVGQFTFSAKQDKNKVAVGEPFTLSVTISGDGNMDSVAAPNLNFPGWLEKYDTEREVETWFDTKTHRLHGRIKYDFVLIPRKEGDFILDPIEFSYFDPGGSRYRTLKQGPFRLKVTPETGRTVTYLQGKRRRIRVTGTDFRHIRPPSAIILTRNNRPATSTPGFWGVLLGPWLVCCVLFGYRKRQDYLEKNPHVARKIKIKSEVKKRLAAAERSLNSDDETFCRELEKAVHDHLSAHLGVSTRGMTRSQLADLLLGRESGSFPVNGSANLHLPDDLGQRILTVLEQIEVLRYSPGSSDNRDRSELLDEVKGLLNQVKS